MNSTIKNILMLLVILGLLYTLNDNIKILFNTNFNKYSNLLENRIYELHNSISKNNIDEIYYSNTFYNINKTFIILIITICTSVIFLYIYLFNKSVLTSAFVILYICLILITLKLLIK